MESRGTAGPARPRRRATLGTVASRAGVSPQTVSNVLNAPELVASETADRVRSAITELGYRPHRGARSLRTRRSKLLALRVEQTARGLSIGIMDTFLHALTAAADRRGYRIVLYTAPDDQAEIDTYDELVAGLDIDAFVLASTHAGDRRTEFLAERGIPVVSFGRPWGQPDRHPWVDVDGAAGTRAATEHLLAAGHTAIAFLGWPDGSEVGEDRLAGWRAAMSAAGLAADAVARSENDPRQGRQAAARLLDEHRPSAIVAVSDATALGAIGELAARGLRAGPDVALTGFDDTPIASAIGLTSVAQPLDAVGAECVRLLTGLLDGPEPAEQHVLLVPELKIRDSSQPQAGQTVPPH